MTWFQRTLHREPMQSCKQSVLLEVRSFEDCAAGVWDGTGFVVSLDNPKAAACSARRVGHAWPCHGRVTGKRWDMCARMM